MKSSVRFFAENPERGTMSFYMETAGKKHFLFNTGYFSKEIFSNYCRGRSLQAVMSDKNYAPNNKKVRTRILQMAKYLSKEYDLGMF